MRHTLIVTGFLGALSGVACAQETVATAQATPPALTAPTLPATTTAPPPPKPMPARPSGGDATQEQIDAWLKADAQPVQSMDAGDPYAEPPLTRPRQIHGEVGVEVSNRGYGGYAAASMPLGQASELDVAVAGGHERTPFGTVNPRSIAVGLRLDGGDVGRWLSRDRCNVPRWGVRLKDDPQVLADGSCVRSDGPSAPARRSAPLAIVEPAPLPAP